MPVPAAADVHSMAPVVTESHEEGTAVYGVPLTSSHACFAL